MRIQFGFCAPPERAKALAAAGIPAAEGIVGTICSWSDEERAANVAAYREAGLRFESCNCLIGGFSLYDDPDFEKTNAYFDEKLPKLADAGMKMLVFGSGGYRRVPEGVDRDFAKSRILDFLRLLSRRIEPYGMTAVIEPLNQKECNILTTSAEAAEYVRELDLPTIRLLVDFYHFLLEGERLSAIADYTGILAHCHIARPVGRRTPAPYDGVDYRGIVDALKGIGYDVMAVGKSADLFNNRGVTQSVADAGNDACLDAAADFLKKDRWRGLLLVDLADTDGHYGRDAAGVARSLEALDARLPELMKLLGEDGLLFVTADDGSRRAPLLVWGLGVEEGVSLPPRKSLADVSATVLEALGCGEKLDGVSFYKDIAL